MDDGTLGQDRHRRLLAPGGHRSLSPCRYAPRVPILRDDDPRVGCLAVPISILAGFIVGALIAASVGVSAAWSSVTGLLVGALGAAIAAWVLLRHK